MNVLENNVKPEAPFSQLENRLLSLMSILSNYDLFSVQTNGTEAFHATSIQLRKDRFLEFGKLFAVPSFTDGKVVGCDAQPDQSFTVRTQNSTYTIRALHSKPESLPRYEKRDWKELADLMDNRYVGNRLNKIMDGEYVLLVVDPYLLGELTAEEQFKIQRIINVYLDGKKLSLQIPRTIYFKVMLHGADKTYAGIYDFANQKPVTEKLIFQENMTDCLEAEILKKYQSFVYSATV